MDTEKRLFIKKEWCKGCGICVAFCPTHVLAIEKGKVVIRLESTCIKCGLCQVRCPDYAILLDTEGYTHEAGSR